MKYLKQTFAIFIALLFGSASAAVPPSNASGEERVDHRLRRRLSDDDSDDEDDDEDALLVKQVGPLALDLPTCNVFASPNPVGVEICNSLGTVDVSTPSEAGALWVKQTETVDVSFSTPSEADALWVKQAETVDVSTPSEADALWVKQAETVDVLFSTPSEADALWVKQTETVDVSTPSEADALWVKQAETVDVSTPSEAGALWVKQAEPVDVSSLTPTKADALWVKQADPLIDHGQNYGTGGYQTSGYSISTDGYYVHNVAGEYAYDQTRGTVPADKTLVLEHVTFQIHDEVTGDVPPDESDEIDMLAEIYVEANGGESSWLYIPLQKSNFGNKRIWTGSESVKCLSEIATRFYIRYYIHGNVEHTTDFYFAETGYLQAA